MTTPSLPALTLTPDGRVVDADTGAIVSIDDPAALPATITDALDNYARAKVEADALAMRLQDRRDAMIHDMVDAYLAHDPDNLADQAKLYAARQTIAETEAALDAYFANRTDKVSLDTGRVLVTWGSPRTTVTLAHPPSWYASEEARRELSRRFGAKTSVPGWGAEMLADTVIDWLSPTAKTSDAPAVKLTVRANGDSR